MPTFTTNETTQQDWRSQMDDEGFLTGTVVRTFDVSASSVATVMEVRAFSSLPRENDAHPESMVLRCNNVNIVRVSPIYFTATASYDSPKRRSGEEDDPPYELAAEIRFSTTSSDEAIDEDVDGNPIAIPNTREAIEGLTRPISDLTVTITKNFAAFDPSTFYVFIDTVNQDTFLGFPPGSAKVNGIEATLQVKDNFPYWAVTVTIQFRKPYRTTADKAWWKRVKCQGYYYYDAAKDPVYVRCTDGDKGYATTPQLLTATGTVLPEGDDAVWLEFQIFESSNFASMGLL